ncbi:MAG: anthranilate synthase component I, partial [Candidatus Omnitrophota bacterium]|nr:anthranilate synthase component I [Candidatus Omnitrophota bacterium]
MYYPTKQQFKKLTRKANVIPVYKEIFADFLTPVSSFLKVKDGYSYLLESVEGEEKIARFSFIGINPSVIFKSRGNCIELIDSGKSKTFITDSPLKEIKKIMARYKIADIKGLPRFFGGMVGYMGYDMVRFFEELPDENTDDLNVEDCIFMLADAQLIFDHSSHKVKVVVNAYKGKGPRANGEALYKDTIKKIDKIIDKLNRPIKPQTKKKTTKSKPLHKIQSNFT